MGLKLWLPLNGDLENKGASIATITNNGTTVDNSGKIGQCYSFNNTCIIIDSTDIQNCFASPSSQFSMACWIYLNSDETDRVIIFGNYTANPFINWELTANCQQRICAGGSSNYTTKSNSTTVPKTTWTHLAVTYDGTTTTFYQNGVSIGSASGANTISTLTASSRFYLGSDSRTGATRLKGKMNDFRLYNHCLSAAEVHEISQGLVLHYKLDDIQLSPPNLLQNSGPHLNATTGWTARSGTALSVVANSFGPYGYVMHSSYGSSAVGVHHQPYSINDLVNGETYTFSGWARASAPCTVRWYNEWFTTQPQVNLTTDWQFVYTTGVIDTSRTYHSDICYPVTSTSDLWIETCMWKLEKGSKPTKWVPHTTDTIYNGFMGDMTKIQDSSGYGHNGTIIGNPNLASGNGRYSAYMRFPDNTGHIQCGVITTSGFSNSYTFAWWGTKSSASTMFWGFSDGIRLNGLYNNTLWNTGDSANNPIYNIGTTTTITAPTVTDWHHYAMTGNGTKCYLYVDGVLYGEAKTYKSISGTQLWINGWQNGTGYAGYMNMSDFRVYCTALDADAIRQLYNVGAKIDNKGNLHTYEFNENGSNKLKKTGIFYNYAVEPYMQLSDGSCWKLMLFHYVDGGRNLFTSSNATYNDGFGLYSRLRDINNFKYNNKYEFYVLQDDKEFRWTQTSQPTASSISGLTTVSGYTNPVNGLAKASQSNTYIGYSAWWGACGCWTSFSTGGKTGIPGFGSHDGNGICTTYLALYTRIDAITYRNASNSHYANNLIEL